MADTNAIKQQQFMFVLAVYLTVLEMAMVPDSDELVQRLRLRDDHSSVETH